MMLNLFIEFNSNVELHKYTGDEIIKSKERAKEIITDIWLKDYEKYNFYSNIYVGNFLFK